MATTAGQILESVRELRAAGAVVSDAAVVIDREQGGRANLAANGITLHSLFTLAELRAAAAT